MNHEGPLGNVKVTATYDDGTCDGHDLGVQSAMPHERDYLDRTAYRAVHFHGPRLADSLAKAADFLIQMEKRLAREPYALCVNAQYSWEDETTDIAWRVTLVLGQPALESDVSSTGRP